MGLRSSVGRRATSAGRCGGLPGAAPGRVPQPLLHRVADLRDGVHVVRETADVDYERVMPTPHHDRLAAGDRPAGARKRLVVPALPPRDDALPGVVNGDRLQGRSISTTGVNVIVGADPCDSSMNGCTTDLAKKLEPRRRPCLRPCRSTGSPRPLSPRPSARVACWFSCAATACVWWRVRGAIGGPSTGLIVWLTPLRGARSRLGASGVQIRPRAR